MKAEGEATVLEMPFVLRVGPLRPPPPPALLC
jgi:hypothetical protein